VIRATFTHVDDTAPAAVVEQVLANPGGADCSVVGRCRLNQVDLCPITYSLSNP
jgi:hypothetical protein